MANEHDDTVGADELRPVPVSKESEEAALTAPSGQALEDCERVLASFAPLNPGHIPAGRRAFCDVDARTRCRRAGGKINDRRRGRLRGAPARCA